MTYALSELKISVESKSNMKGSNFYILPIRYHMLFSIDWKAGA